MSQKHTLIVSADLLKSQVKAFTRKDGAFVAAHSDKRQAATPKFHVRDNAGNTHKVFEGPNAKHEATQHMLKMNKAGGRFSTRDVTPTDDTPKSAAAPALGTHAKALRESSKPGDMDHWHNQVAADHMAAGDHKALGATLRSMDTAARDHVLEHIHPDHHAGLGFETINHARSVAGYDKKFPAAKPKAAKRAPTKKAEDAKPVSQALPEKLEDANPHARMLHEKAKKGEASHADAAAALHHASKLHGELATKLEKEHGDFSDYEHHSNASNQFKKAAEWHDAAAGGFDFGGLKKSMLIVRPDLLK